MQMTYAAHGTESKDTKSTLYNCSIQASRS